MVLVLTFCAHSTLIAYCAQSNSEHCNLDRRESRLGREDWDGTVTGGRAQDIATTENSDYSESAWE